MCYVETSKQYIIVAIKINICIPTKEIKEKV